MTVIFDDQPDTTASEESRQLVPGTNGEGRKARIGGGGGRKQAHMEEKISTFLSSFTLQRSSTHQGCDQGSHILDMTGAKTREHHENGLISRSRMNDAS